MHTVHKEHNQIKDQQLKVKQRMQIYMEQNDHTHTKKIEAVILIQYIIEFKTRSITRGRENLIKIKWSIHPNKMIINIYASQNVSQNTWSKNLEMKGYTDNSEIVVGLFCATSQIIMKTYRQMSAQIQNI